MLRTYHPLQKSHCDHYFVSYGEGFFHCDTGDRATTYENTLYIRANSPKEALEIGLELASKVQDDFTDEDGITFRVDFMGITNVMPIHEKMNSGSEVGWLDLTGIDDNSLKGRIAGVTSESAIAYFDLISEDESEYPPYVKASFNSELDEVVTCPEPKGK